MTWRLVSCDELKAPRALRRRDPVRDPLTGLPKPDNMPDVGGYPVEARHYVWRHRCGALAVTQGLAEDKIGECGRCHGR